jgi:hypothetical protein
MKITYKKTVMEQITEAMFDGTRRTIEKVELTSEEMAELLHSLSEKSLGEMLYIDEKGYRYLKYAGFTIRGIAE